MISDSIAKAWLAAWDGDAHSRHLGHNGIEPFACDDLTALSTAIHSLGEEAPSDEALRKVGELFDALCAARWDNEFGERIEICLLLAYLGWRNSFVLEYEAESQEWFRAAEQLANESFVAKECLLSFFGLPTAKRSEELFLRFLGTESDAFLATMVLRAERNRLFSLVSEVTVEVYRWLARTNPEPRSLIWEWVLGELSHLKASVTRLVGRRKEAGFWSTLSRRHFIRLPSSLPLLAKSASNRLIDAYNRHRVVPFESRCNRLVMILSRFGMQNEINVCELSLAMAMKSAGMDAEARARMENIVLKNRNGAFHGLLGTALCNLAELRWTHGATNEAHVLMTEALEAAEMSGNRVILGSMLLTVGSVRIGEGQIAAGIEAYRRGVDLVKTGGEGPWLAYTEICLAEALLAGGQWPEALDQLARAIPVVRAEGMIQEAIHALKLRKDAYAMAKTRYLAD